MEDYPPGVKAVYDFHIGVAQTTGKVLGGILIAIGVAVGLSLLGHLKSARGIEVAAYGLAPFMPIILGLLAMKKIPVSAKLKMGSVFELILNHPEGVARVCEASTTAKLGLDKHSLTTTAMLWDGKREFGPPPKTGNLKIWVFRKLDHEPEEFVIAPEHRAALCKDMLEALKKGNGETLWGADTLRAKDVN